MIKKSLLGLLSMGSLLRYLLERDEGSLITHEREAEWKIKFVKRAIEAFLEALKEYDMSVTLIAASKLRDFLDKIKDRPVGSVLTKEEADNIKKIMMALENTLRAEAEGKHSFFTTDKKIPMDKLTSKQDTLFPPGSSKNSQGSLSTTLGKRGCVLPSNVIRLLLFTFYELPRSA